jgi:hypothetical protein
MPKYFNMSHFLELRRLLALCEDAKNWKRTLIILGLPGSGKSALYHLLGIPYCDEVVDLDSLGHFDDGKWVVSLDRLPVADIYIGWVDNYQELIQHVSRPYVALISRDSVAMAESLLHRYSCELSYAQDLDPAYVRVIKDRSSWTALELSSILRNEFRALFSDLSRISYRDFFELVTFNMPYFPLPKDCGRADAWDVSLSSSWHVWMCCVYTVIHADARIGAKGNHTHLYDKRLATPKLRDSLYQMLGFPFEASGKLSGGVDA